MENQEFIKKVMDRVKNVITDVIIETEFLDIKADVYENNHFDVATHEQGEFCGIGIMPFEMYREEEILADCNVDNCYYREMNERYRVDFTLGELAFTTDEEIKQKVLEMLKLYEKSIYYCMAELDACSKDGEEYKLTYDKEFCEYHLYVLSVSDNDYSVYDEDGQFLRFVSVD